FFRDGGQIEPPSILVIHHTDSDKPEQADLVDKSHAARGYPQSFIGSGSHIAYHFIVGKDGTIKQNRSLSERTGHTRSQRIHLRSIAIGVAGDFTKEQPTPQQLQALRNLIRQLGSVFLFQRIMPHREASPTACPGVKLEEALKDVWREPDLGDPYLVS